MFEDRLKNLDSLINKFKYLNKDWLEQKIVLKLHIWGIGILWSFQKSKLT